MKTKPDNIYEFEATDVPSFNELTGELRCAIKREDGQGNVFLQATCKKLTLEQIEAEIADCEKRLSELSILIQRRGRWWDFTEDYINVEKRLCELERMRNDLAGTVTVTIPIGCVKESFMKLIMGEDDL